MRITLPYKFLVIWRSSIWALNPSPCQGKAPSASCSRRRMRWTIQVAFPPPFPGLASLRVIWHCCPWASFFRSQFVPGSLWSQAEQSLFPQANQADTLVSQLPDAFFISLLLIVSIPPASLGKLFHSSQKQTTQSKAVSCPLGKACFPAPWLTRTQERPAHLWLLSTSTTAAVMLGWGWWGG